MTNYATISNATFDAAAALVPPPYGPLTRVGSLETTPRALPNSHTPIAVTGQGSVAFNISYAEMQNEGVRQRIIEEAYGINSLFVKAFQHIDVLYHYMLSMSPSLLTAPKTDLDDIMRALKTLPAFMANSPYVAFIETDKAKKVRARFTVGGAGATRSVTNTSTGSISLYLWDWGDGEYSMGAAPADHVYDVDGTYVIKLTAIGPGGEDQWSDSEVVDVP